MAECTKKLYKVRREALLALRAIRRRAEARACKAPTGAYFCTPCRGWHLTSKSRTQVPPWA